MVCIILCFSFVLRQCNHGCLLVLSRICFWLTLHNQAFRSVSGAHEGRRPEGASNGGSMCSAECTLCPNTADRKIPNSEILRPSVHYYVLTCVHLRIRRHAARATGTQEIESERYRDRDVELFCSAPREPWRQQPA